MDRELEVMVAAEVTSTVWTAACEATIARQQVIMDS